MNQRKTCFHPGEGYFLEGPKSRRNELLFAFNVSFQFIRGFRALHFIGPCFTPKISASNERNAPWLSFLNGNKAANN